MRRARPKPPRLRVVKRKPRKPSGNNNQVYDEDVLRWRRMFSDEEALAAAQLAGPGSPGLASCSSPPVLSPEACGNALQYVSTLTDDARHALFKHCGLVARHERMLLEGQERLKYVQDQVREMKARMPPPPPPPPPRSTLKGPDVTLEPVSEPSCWASCCGLFPLPPPPVPPPRPGPLIIQLPDPSYFREAAAKRNAAARRQPPQPEEAILAVPSQATVSPGEGAIEPTVSEPVSARAGGAGSGAPASADAVGGASSASAPASAVVTAELPGQLEAAVVTHADERAATAAAAPPLPPPPKLSPLAVSSFTRRPSGAPQSLLRPLGPLSLPALGSAAAAGLPSPAKGGLRGGDRGAASAGTTDIVTGAMVRPLAEAANTGPSAAVDMSRFQDPDSIRRIIRIQALQRGRMARKLVAGLRADRQQQLQMQHQAQVLPVQEIEAERVEEVEEVEEEEETGFAGTRNAAEGNAKQQLPDRIGPQQRQQHQEQPVGGVEAGDSFGTEVQTPFGDNARPMQSSFGGPGGGARQLPPLPLGGPSGRAGRAWGGEDGGGEVTLAHNAANIMPAAATDVTPGAADQPHFDLSRYETPDAIKKVTRIQAVQRGRMARKRVAEMRTVQRVGQVK
ncbi:hypothetical protein VaNZ11_006171 [Volvox africanus]|uniref:Uncharacterized protein n=1 Tax=Volvox africanus TaxID=51714 RepID=A0ABQ5S049_9CHLO|nr:hypothetical protein VaNZ11_006171 [Volvox africanus]